MLVNRTFFIQEWVKVNNDLTGEIILNCLVKFCQETEPELWKRIFRKGQQRDKVVEEYISSGGLILMDGNAVRQENQSRRVAMVFEKDSKEFQLILPMMVKLQGQLHPTLDCKVVFGRLYIIYDAICENCPQWKGELAETILNPRAFTEEEKQSILYVKHAVDYIMVAHSKTPTLLPSGIVEASKQIIQLMDIFQN